jgi:hypothetical protein
LAHILAHNRSPIPHHLKGLDCSPVL